MWGNPDYKPLFSGEPEAGRLLREISSLSRVDVTPGNTLLIWDEIQFCPEALSVISDFVESDFGFDIIVYIRIVDDNRVYWYWWIIK